MELLIYQEQQQHITALSDIMDPRDIQAIRTLEREDPMFIVSPDIEARAVRIINGYTTRSIDVAILETAKILGNDLTDYGNLILAGRLYLMMELRNAPKDIIDYVVALDKRLNSNVKTYMIQHFARLDELLSKYWWINYRYDYSSANTLVGMYLQRPHVKSGVAETAAHMFMRIAVQLYHRHSIEDVESCYHDMAMSYYTMATPTILNAGTKRSQMSSCFLMSIDDSLQSMYATIYNAAIVSGAGGGLGIDFSRLRHSEIDNVGMASGVVPLMKVLNSTLLHVDQGGGKRKGAGATFLRTHHIDLKEYIKTVDPIGDHNARTHDLNPSLWTSWLFWERVRSDGDITLFCPAKTPQLNDVYGKEFERLYIEMENDPNIAVGYRNKVKATDILKLIHDIERKSGKPFIMSGDSANFKSPHKHLGYIRCSNLCQEIVEYTDGNTPNICNLCSINLTRFARSTYDTPPVTVNEAIDRMDFQTLCKMTRNALRNLNNVIDNNFYPTMSQDGSDGDKNVLSKTNHSHRAVGLGAQGMAELFARLDVIYNSEIANKLDEVIYAAIYYNALVSSVQSAIIDGVCDIFKGSTFSRGELQFDLWRQEHELRWGKCPSVTGARQYNDTLPVHPMLWGQESIKLHDNNDREMDVIKPDWNDLRRVIMKYGLRNSLTTAQMPTGSTSRLFRNTESNEAPIRNIYTAKVISGNFPIINSWMVRDLKLIGLWNNITKDYIITNDGMLTGLSQYVAENRDMFPEYRDTPQTTARLEHLESKYRTMWEISQKEIMTRSANRGKYIDQSQSMSLFMEDATDRKLKAAHLYADEIGLKTITYYMRSQASRRSRPLTVNPGMAKSVITNNSYPTVPTALQTIISSTSAVEKNKTVKSEIICNDNMCCGS